MAIQLSDIITQMINNTNTFEGPYKDMWNNCFQWSALEQYCVFHNISPEILALEMYGIWSTWYFDKNIRDDISDIHTEYQGRDLSDVGEYIINDLWDLYSSIYFKQYSLHLSKTYGNPRRNMSYPTYTKLRQIGNLTTKTFTPNPRYDFANTYCITPMFGINDYFLELDKY